MDKKLKTKWVKALRSGKYKQGQQKLKYRDKFCCLGVLRYLMPEPMRNLPMHLKYNELLNPEQQRFAGLKKKNQAILARKNDKGQSFEKIAAFIETHL